MVVNLLIHEAVERALLFTQPSGLVSNDLGKTHEQSCMLPAAFRLLKSFLRFQACLDLLDGSYYYSPVLIRHHIYGLSIVSEQCQQM